MECAEFQTCKAARTSRVVNAQYVAELRHRLRVAETMDPADWQEAHSGTAPVMVKVDARRDAELTRRRDVDQRLWDAMTVEQEQAALAIRDGFELVMDGTRGVTFRYDDRAPGGSASGESDRVVVLRTEYWTWGKECIVHGISHSAAMDILFFGLPVSAVDRNRGKKAPWARRNLFNALTLYCAQRGWVQSGAH